MSGYNHFAGMKSADIITVGPSKAADVVNYTSLSTAFDNMVPGGHMIIYPGTYSLSATETINYSCTIEGVGEVIINGGTAGVEDRLFMINKPPAGTATTTIKFKNVQITNAFSAADGIEIDNDGGATGDLVTIWEDVGVSTNSGLAFDIDQTTNTIDVYHYILGNKRRPLNDDCNFALTKAGSEIHVEGYLLDGGETFILGTADVASVYYLNNIVFSSAALTSGGASSIIINMLNCAKVASDAIAAPALTDLDATGDENILTGSILT